MNKETGQDDESDHLLAMITPEDEAAMLRETRKRAKKLYGFSEKDLDSLYGKIGRRK